MPQSQMKEVHTHIVIDKTK